MDNALCDILQMGGAIAHKYLAIAAEHDSDFYAHLPTVGSLSFELALRCNQTRDAAFRVGVAGLMHDIGKVLIDRETWNAPRSLTESEWAEMRQHPELGTRLVRGFNDPQLLDMIRSHHERINGSGYGRGLVGSQISLSTRILSVADAYAVIRQGRPYAPSQPAVRDREFEAR